MNPLPSGTVTFLFTDLEGSTKLLQKLGEGYAHVLAAHHEILRACVEKIMDESLIPKAIRFLLRSRAQWTR